jgi:hypothetical protein
MVCEVADEGAARKGARAHALLALHWSVRAAACDDHVVGALATQPNTETRKKTQESEEDKEEGDEVLSVANLCKRRRLQTADGLARQARARVRYKGSPWLKRGGNGVWRLGTSVWLWPTQTLSNLFVDEDTFSYAPFFLHLWKKGTI